MTDLATRTSRSAELRAQFGHPVIDGDGHWLEPMPILLDFLRDAGGPAVADRFLDFRHELMAGWYDMTPEERVSKRVLRPLAWGEAGNTLDRATGMAPGLMRERLDEFGIDVSIVYPTQGLGAVHIQDADIRHAFARAMNEMTAELFAPYRDRLVPVAVIPSFTPQEAIEELEYAVNELGFRSMYMTCTIRRPIAAYAEGDSAGSFYGPTAYYVDHIGLDSPHDYDPLWAKAVELGVAVTTHAGGMGWPDRMSVTNSVFNHVGHFAAANHAAAKSLFLGGVTKRFPDLRFAFLEGGSGWACNLLLDLVGHWEKRRLPALMQNLSPAQLDMARLTELLTEYGGPAYQGRVEELLGAPSKHPDTTVEELVAREEREGPGNPMYIDDFNYLEGVDTEEELVALFRDRFYFGAEADDPTVRWAFDEALGLDLKAIFSSDISHWDVTNMAETVEEAYELVEHGLIDEAAFRKFVFEYPAELHARMNPGYFEGTPIAGEVRELLP